MPKVGSPEVAIVSAFTALSCNSSQGRAPNDNDTAASSVVIVASETPPASSGSRVVDGAVSKEPTRLAALRTSPSWSQFKELWRELNEIAPAGAADPMRRGEYANSLDDKRAAALSPKAEEAIRTMAAEDLLSDAEAAFLRHTVQLRIQNMTRGFTHLMMMHRMPAPSETELASSVQRLERKLDVLVKLRSEGKIGSKEFALALDRVQREAITMYVAGALSKQGYGAPALERPADGEAFLAEMRNKFERARRDGGIDDATAQLVEESKALVPAIRELLAELEQ